MRFFRYFPKTLDGQGNILTNLSKKILLGKNLSEQAVVYYTYYLKDGERVDVLSKRLYGSEEYQWVILLINNIMDPRQELPLTNREFEHYLTDVYGSVENALTTVHHLEDEYGEIVDSQYPLSKREVSVYEFEERKNEEKRLIKLVRPEYISAFVEELKRVMSSE